MLFRMLQVLYFFHQHYPQYVCCAQYGSFRSSLILCFPGVLLVEVISRLFQFPLLLLGLLLFSNITCAVFLLYSF